MIETTLALSLALGAMNAPLETLAQLKTVSQAPPAPAAAGPAAPAEAWKKILETVRRDGVKGGDKDFFTQSLTGVAGEPKKYHGVTVFLDGGSVKFSVVGVEFTVESSVLTLSSGVIVTETWVLLATSSGVVDQIIYKKRVDTPGAGAVASTPMVVDLADPRAKAQFDSVIAYWAARSTR